MYEAFEHTADLGLRISAPDLNSLFADAGKALFATIVADLDDIRLEQVQEIRVEGTARDYLLFDWLNELLYQFEAQGMLFAQFDVTVSDSGLTALVRGEPVDFDRHQMSNEVKAITYHHLTVEQTPDGWRAEVIVDI